MTITQDQIQKIARNLSKIPGGNEKLAGNIQDILKYMELLNEVDTDGIKPTVSVVTQGQALRADIQTDKKVPANELLKCSPQKVVGEQIILPNIMK